MGMSILCVYKTFDVSPLRRLFNLCLWSWIFMSLFFGGVAPPSFYIRLNLKSFRFSAFSLITEECIISSFSSLSLSVKYFFFGYFSFSSLSILSATTFYCLVTNPEFKDDVYESGSYVLFLFSNWLKCVILESSRLNNVGSDIVKFMFSTFSPLPFFFFCFFAFVSEVCSCWSWYRTSSLFGLSLDGISDGITVLRSDYSTITVSSS